MGISPFLDYGHVVPKCFLEKTLVSELTVAQPGINFPPFMHLGISQYPATGPVMLQHTFLTFTTYFSIRSIHIFFPYYLSCGVSVPYMPPCLHFPSSLSCYQSCLFQAARFDCPEWLICNTADAGIFEFASTSRAEECIFVAWCLNSVERYVSCVGAFAKFRNSSISFVMFVRPSVRLEQLGS